MSTAQGAGRRGTSAARPGGCVYGLLITVDYGSAVCQCISQPGGGPAKKLLTNIALRADERSVRYEF